ncbi:MAG: LysR family transcriptional regulator [Lachnospiraceae bacterium]|nr:LysR family transcriptional regulator [Lachnospiraceae bacterium]
MELKQLESFVSVADNLSFSKAARSLYLTQPTVSAHIAQLEKDLGCRLFERTTKSLRLTETGKSIYPLAARMVALKSSIEEETKDKAEKTVCIGASTIPATYLLPGILAELASSENMKFSIRQGNSSEIEQMVSDGAVEAGVIGRVPQDQGLESELLCSDTLVLVTPVNEYYTGLRKNRADIGTLLAEPMILREEGSGTQKAADLFLEKYSEKPLNVIIRSNDQEAIKRMVAAGAGVSVMSVYAAEELEKEGKVYCYPLKLEEERRFYIVYRKDRELSQAVKKFTSAAHIRFGLRKKRAKT